MSLDDWSSEGLLRPLSARRAAFADLLAAVDRDLTDTALPGLSIDRQFALAYQAALGLGAMILRTHNLRAAGEGHHWVTFEALPLIMGEGERKRSKYFQGCRVKRNITDYERAGGISQTEADELLVEARAFRTRVLSFLRDNYPTLSPR